MLDCNYSFNLLHRDSKMNSNSVIGRGDQDLMSMSKGDVSKTLFDAIEWPQILRSGVFLEPKDVSGLRIYFFLFIMLNNQFS